MAHLGQLSYERLVEGVVRAWAAHHPLDVAAVRKATASVLARRGDDKGYAQHGWVKGGIPDALNRAMVKKFGVMWKSDPEVHRAFWRIFEIGRFNNDERSGY